MDYGALCTGAVRILDSFDPLNHNLATFVPTFCKENQIEASDDDLEFFETIFNGCQDHAQLLQIIISSFYDDSEGILFRHANLYRMVAFMCIFCMDSVGSDTVQKFSKTGHRSVITKLLPFLYNESKLAQCCIPRLRIKYDVKYLDAIFIAPLRRHAPAMCTFVEEMQVIKPPGNPSQVKAKLTKPAPFRLTKQKPRRIQEPVPVEMLQKPREVPHSTYVPSRDMKALQAKAQENKRDALERHRKANEETFTLVTRKPIVATYTKKAHECHDKALRLPLGRVPAQVPCPHIKLNTAAILREEALFRRKEEEERRLVHEYENGLGDRTAFFQWQNEKRLRDEDRSRLATQRRRLEGLMSHEDAINAKFEQTRINNVVVREMQKQSDEIQRQIAMQEKELESLNRIKVEEATLSHKKAREAKIRACLERKRQAEELHRDMERLKRDADIQAMEEAERRQTVIRDIRALESAPIKKPQKIDLTETSGTGLLLEMSLMELRERLAMLKVADEKAREERRSDIIRTKEVKLKELDDRMQCITRFRKEASEQRSASRELRVKDKGTAKTDAPKDQTILDLERRLQNKRARRQQAKAQTSSEKHEHLRAQRLQFSHRQEEKRWYEVDPPRGGKAVELS